MTKQKIKIQTHFDTFNPKDYLLEYYHYSEVSQENKVILQFEHEAYQAIFKHLTFARMLEFGGGPTIYQLIASAAYDVKIDFTEYLFANLAEVQKWINDEKGQYNWDKFIQYALKLEGLETTHEQVQVRKRQIRSKVQQLFECDARSVDPIGERRAPYDILGMHFVLESITSDLSQWNTMMKNVLKIVAPGGFAIIGAIIGAQHYLVGDKFYPAVPVNEIDVIEVLKAQEWDVWDTVFIPAQHKKDQGYKGLFMLLGRKSA